MTDGKYYQFTLQNFPEKYNTFEIVNELNQQLSKQYIQLKLAWMEFKELKTNQNQTQPKPNQDFIKRQENSLKKLHWWEGRLFIFSNSIGFKEKEDLHIIQFVRPQLQNYSPIYLARFYDYSLFIEALIQAPNKALISSPVPLEIIFDTTDLVQQEIYKKKSCQIRLFGTQTQLDKAKKIADDGMLIIGSKEVNFGKAELVNPLIIPEDLRTSSILFETLGQNIDAGIFKQNPHNTFSYFKYWSLEQVKYVYQSQVDIGPVQIILFKLTDKTFRANVIYDICYQQTRRMSFKVEFDIKSSQNQSPTTQDPNICYSDAPILIEKESNKKLLNIYLKFNGQPKCYFSESLSNKLYYEPIVRTWNRCQNFLVSKCDLIYAQLIKNYNVIRVQISSDQCNSFDFLNFCKTIENNALLRNYYPKPSISNQLKVLNQEKFDLSEENFLLMLENKKIPQIPKRLIWMLVSCFLSPDPIVFASEGQYNQLLDLFLQNSQSLGLIYTALKNIREQFLQSKKSKKKLYFTFQELLNQVQRYVQKNQESTKAHYVPKEMRKALLTPSGVYPNYFCQETFALQNAVINEIHKKIKDRSSLKFALLLLEIRDEDGNILEYNHSYEQNIKNFQTQILHCAYYRKIIQDGVTILGDKYFFAGYSRTMTKNHQCVLINEHYLIQLSRTIFGGALDSRFDLKKIIPLAEIMEILQEVYNDVEDFVTIKEINEQIEPDDTDLFQNNLFITENSEIYRPEYQKKLLQYQGRITNSILDKIKQIIFDQQISFTTFIIRKGEYQGLLQLDPNDQSNHIIVNSEMRQPNSPYNHMLSDNSIIQIELNQFETIQILSYGLYKPCVLQMYHLINVAFLGSTKPATIQIWKNISTYLQQLMETYKSYTQKEQTNLSPQKQKFEGFQKFFSKDKRYLKKSLKSLKNFNDSKSFDNFFNLRIPIKHGAKLLAVYDQDLKPNQVYIQISETNNFMDSYEINESQVIIFKYYALHYESIQTFETVRDKNLINSLKKRYLNVIVFSSDMNYKLFPIRDGDLKQEFTVIWDIGLIFSLKTQKPDHEYYFNQLNFDEIQQEDDNQQILQAFKATKNYEESIFNSLIQSNKQNNGKELIWLDICRNFLVDAFTLNIGSYNSKSLRYLYTKIAITILYESIQMNQKDVEVLKSQNITIEDMQTVLTSLNIAALKQFWFYSTQGMFHRFDELSRRTIQQFQSREIPFINLLESNK